MHISRADECPDGETAPHDRQPLANAQNTMTTTMTNITTTTSPSNGANVDATESHSRSAPPAQSDPEHSRQNHSAHSQGQTASRVAQNGELSHSMDPAGNSILTLAHDSGDADSGAATLLVSPPVSPSSARGGYAHLASIHSVHPQLDLKLNNRFRVMPSNDQIRELQTVIRDKATLRGDFKFYADRLIRLVVEEGLNQLPIEPADVRTPTGNLFQGIRYLKGNCGVSIVRSGESMEQGLRDCCRSIRIGKILIESDENNQARVLYAKFPRDIAERKILLLYPIMSTGLAVIESVKVLLSHGAREDNLILLNLFSSPRAAKMLNSSFPKMSVLTSDINQVSPNHFGQRYFGTD